MKFNSQCKAIIESLSRVNCEAYISFLMLENNRHQKEIKRLLASCRVLRLPPRNEYYDTFLKLNQTAIYRHRQDIQGTRECILRAEDRMEVLSEQG